MHTASWIMANIYIWDAAATLCAKHTSASSVPAYAFVYMHASVCSTAWPVDLADWWNAQETVHERFRTEFERHFMFKRVPRSKMDAMHQHPSIDILLLRRRSVPQQG